MIDVNKIYNDDCMNILKQIPDKSIDLVLIDPLYLYDKGGGGKGKVAKSIDFRNKLLRTKELTDGFNIIVLDELCRILKKINFYIFCSKKQILLLLDYFKNKANTFDLLCWHKTNPPPLANNIYLNDTEYCLNFRDKNCIINGTIAQKKKYFITGINQKDKILYSHPTIKPVEIFKQLIINGTKENDLVLDCFSGSGTTAIACLELKRKFICIEKDEEYWQKSVERLENYNKQLKLF